LVRFQHTERSALLALPAVPYDPATWARLRLYRDCHLTFEQAYYSAPFRLVGQELWVRGGARTVEIYGDDHQLIATHDRAAPGERRTVLAHLPPEKVPGLVLTRETCQQQAEAVGPATAVVVGELLAHRPEDRLRSADRLVRLAEKVGPERLERACARAHAFGGDDYPTVKRILAANLEEEASAPEAAAATSVGALSLTPPTFTFARSADEYAIGVLSASSLAATAEKIRRLAALPTVELRRRLRPRPASAQPCRRRKSKSRPPEQDALRRRALDFRRRAKQRSDSVRRPQPRSQRRRVSRWLQTATVAARSRGRYLWAGQDERFA